MIPTLSILNNNSIEIEEDPRNITPLPSYAEDLRQLLLNFKEIVPLNKVWSALSEPCITTNAFLLSQIESGSKAVVQKRRASLG